MTTAKIHHATLAAAAKAGIVLTQDGDAVTATSKKPKFEFVITATGKQAFEDAMAYRAIVTEYSLVSVDLVDGVWRLTLEGLEEGVEAERLQKALDAILDAAQEAGVDVSEEKETSVVVPDRYKKEYAARGDATCCGDWLAVTLKSQFDVTTPDGKQFDPSLFADCLIANGVDMTGKWASLPESGQKGWQGRYRMNGRQLLEIRVAMTGVLHLRGETLVVPQEDLEILWRKHPEAYTDWEEARQPAKTDEKGKSRKKAEADAQ